MSAEKKTMKIYNISDVPTPSLENNNLVGHVFAAGKALVAPGDYAEVDKDDAATLAALPGMVSLGLAAIDQLPASYVVAKDKMQKSKKPGPSTSAMPVADVDQLTPMKKKG
jgi:hypothetical protein